MFCRWICPNCIPVSCHADVLLSFKQILIHDHVASPPSFLSLGPSPATIGKWIWLWILFCVLSIGSEAARASVAAKGSFILGTRSIRTRRVTFSLIISEEFRLLSAAVLDHYSDFVYHPLLSNNGSNFESAKLHECGSLRSSNK